MTAPVASTRRQIPNPFCRAPGGAAHPRLAGGSSLIELMVAITIGLMVLTALAALFAYNSRARAELDQSGQQVENGRYAMELLREDIHLAGYYGQYTLSGATPLEVSPCQTALANMGWSASARTVPGWISGFRAGDDLPAGCTLSKLKSNTDILVIRRVSTTAVTVATAGITANQSNFYLQASACPGDGQPFVVAAGGAGAGTFNLRQKDCSAAAELRKFETHAYYIGTCSVCTGTADTIPTLRRLELSGGSISDLALVEGIEAMRIDYGIDSNSDGQIDATRRCTSDATRYRYCDAATFANAMGLRVYLLARNLKSTAGYTDSKTYDMGISGSIRPGGAYQRHVYGAMVAVVNAAGRREH